MGDRKHFRQEMSSENSQRRDSDRMMSYNGRLGSTHWSRPLPFDILPAITLKWALGKTVGRAYLAFIQVPSATLRVLTDLGSCPQSTQGVQYPLNCDLQSSSYTH